MLPPTPLSLLCAILLCLPLAAIFTFTTPSSTTSGGGATTTTTTTSLPISLTSTTTLTQVKSTQIKNQTHNTKTPPPPLPPPPPPPPPLIKLADDAPFLRLASRVDPTPKPRKKLAFMFLTTTPLPFAPLWELYFTHIPKNLYNIYVHADPVPNYTTPFRGVFANRVIPSTPTRRHTPTLIAAARRLLAHALLHDASNYMFALLSPSCIPIRSFNYTYRTLIKSRKSFIEILKDEPGAWERWAARGEETMPPEVKYGDFRIGSQFWVVKRKHARIIVGDRRIWSKFRMPCLSDDTCYPEEQYFPTLLSMVDPRGCVACTLTHVDWRESHGGHPRTYEGDEVEPELIAALRLDRPRYGDGSNSSVKGRSDPFLFARKFAPGALHRLMNIAKDVLFKD